MIDRSDAPAVAAEVATSPAVMLALVYSTGI